MKNILKILEWNINQRSNSECKLLDFIIKEICKSDIVVLVEYKQNSNFENALEKMGYNVNSNTPIDGQNEILIAVKSDLEIVDKSLNQIPNHTQDDSPNFLQVNVKFNNEIVPIIGVRIRVETDNTATEDKKRNFKINQFVVLDNYLSKLKNNKVFCTGDFNAYWSDSTGCIWHNKKNKTLPNTQNKYEYFTPIWNLSNNSFSICIIDESSKRLKQISVDHIIAKNVKVTNPNYYWDFMKLDSKYDGLVPNSYKSSKDMVGYPDHAILLAEIEV